MRSYLNVEGMSEILPILEIVIEGLAHHFGPQTEFVVHDYSRDLDSSIVGITNGSLTGRAVGDGGTQIGISHSHLTNLPPEQAQGKFKYMSQTKAGRILSSSTIWFYGREGNIVGSLCVNSDISPYLQMKNLLKEVVQFEQEDSDGAIVVGDIDSVLISLIKESIMHVGLPVSEMDREQKKEGIKFLRDKGAFKIVKSSALVASYYDISKFTVYNYLNEIEAEET